MKKVLLFSSLLALGAAASYGMATETATCGSFGTISAIQNAGTCQVGDKLFSNFVYTAGTGNPTAADVTVAGTVSPSSETFGLQFGSSLNTAWVSGFTLSFDVAIDQAACQSLYGAGAGCYISGTQDQMQGGAAGASNTATLTVTHTTGGTVSLNALNTNNETGQILGLNQATMSDSFVGAGSASYPVTQFGTEVFQGTVPEPVSMSLTGLGLLGLGFFGRRRLKA